MQAIRTTLVVAEQPARLSVLALSLRSAGYTVVTSQSATALETFERARPNIVVMDGSFARRHAMVLPADRILRGGVRWLFLTQAPPDSEIAHWSATLAERGLTPIRVELPNASDAATTLTPLLAPPAPPVRPTGPVADVEAAAFLVGQWARASTGVVNAPLRNLSARLYEGDAADEDSRRTLVRMLYEGGLSFTRMDMPKPPAVRPLAPELWEAARRSAQPEMVLERLDNMLVERPAGRRVQELPLPHDLARLLGVARDRRNIAELCQVAGVKPTSIAGPLSALVRLGFFHLRPYTGLAHERLVTPAVSSPTPARAELPRALAQATGSPPRAQLVQHRLEREWKVLSESDDRGVLGLPADATPELIDQAIARQSRRYAELRTASDLTPEARALAEKILARVEEAAQNLRTGSTLTPEVVQEPEVAFRQGIRCMQKEAWTEACQWFRAARLLEPRSALYVGYLGWAIYNNQGLPRESRRHKALELLRLADASAEPIPELQVFQAAVEAENGDIDQAFARVNRVLARNPHHREARELDARLRDTYSR